MEGKKKEKERKEKKRVPLIIENQVIGFDWFASSSPVIHPPTLAIACLHYLLCMHLPKGGGGSER